MQHDNEYTRERENTFAWKVLFEDITLKQIWTPLYGEILHVITKNNEHDRFVIALECFQRWHGTRWRDYLLDNWRSSIHGKGLEVPCTYTFVGMSKDDQAAGEGLH